MGPMELRTVFNRRYIHALCMTVVQLMVAGFAGLCYGKRPDSTVAVSRRLHAIKL